MDEQFKKELFNLNILLRINQIIQRGDIKDNWISYRQIIEKFSDDCVLKPSFTENMIYRSEKPGETAESFNRLCEVIAILAFAPGGVEFMGARYQVPEAVWLSSLC